MKMVVTYLILAVCGYLAYQKFGPSLLASFQTPAPVAPVATVSIAPAPVYTAAPVPAGKIDLGFHPGSMNPPDKNHLTTEDAVESGAKP